MNSCSQLRTHAVHYGQRSGVMRFAVASMRDDLAAVFSRFHLAGAPRDENCNS